MGFIDELEDGKVKEWYTYHKLDEFLEDTGKRAINQGYVFDKQSGLFIRPHFNENTTRQLKSTIVDIIFPMPVDRHTHYDVGEAIKVISGTGFFYYRNKREVLENGTEKFVPVETMHSFSPDKGQFLELEIAYTGIFNPEEEMCITPFYEFKPWKELYK